MTKADRTAWLEVNDRQFPLVGRTFSLGRAKDNNVVLTSAKVSRRHALVHAQGDAEFSLVDLGSSNGTHLNGRRVVQPMVLQPGDVIQIGEQSLVFHHESDAATEENIYATEPLVTVRDVREMTCWFLLIDMENFVTLSASMAADELGRTVGLWISECQRAIEKHGGTVNKFLGDGLLAHWNARTTDVNNVALALETFRSMQLRAQPAFRMALHLGKAVFGAAHAPGETTTLGQDLNFLFRMERVAATNRFPCVISQAARAQLPPTFDCEALGAFPLKGFEGAHDFFGYRSDFTS